MKTVSPKRTTRRFFHVVSYRLEGGGLVVSVLNTELVEKSLKDSEALRKAFLKNKMNKALFTNPGRFRRAAEIFDPSDETTEASTTDQSYLSRLWNPDGSKKHSRFVLKLHGPTTFCRILITSGPMKNPLMRPSLMKIYVIPRSNFS